MDVGDAGEGASSEVENGSGGNVEFCEAAAGAGGKFFGDAGDLDFIAHSASEFAVGVVDEDGFGGGGVAIGIGIFFLDVEAVELG